MRPARREARNTRAAAWSGRGQRRSAGLKPGRLRVIWSACAGAVRPGRPADRHPALRLGLDRPRRPSLGEQHHAWTLPPPAHELDDPQPGAWQPGYLHFASPAVASVHHCSGQSLLCLQVGHADLILITCARVLLKTRPGPGARPSNLGLQVLALSTTVNEGWHCTSSNCGARRNTIPYDRRPRTSPGVRARGVYPRAVPDARGNPPHGTTMAIAARQRRTTRDQSRQPPPWQPTP